MLTEQNAKLSAFFLAVLFVVYYGYQLAVHGNRTCDDLLTGGHYFSDGKWQPLTCMVHHYNAEDTSQCLKAQRIVLIGDSRLRQLYDGLLDIHNIEHEEGEKHSNKKHVHVVEEYNTVYEFFWNPVVNQTTVSLYEELLASDKPPSLVIHGAASWTIKLNMASSEALTSYRDNLTKVVPQLEKLTDESEVIWMMQAPVKRYKFDERRYMLSNEELKKYNDAAAEVLGLTDVKLWYSVGDIAEQCSGEPEEDDGLHLANDALAESLQVILNLHCNTNIRPHDATCCTERRPHPNIVQISCLILFLLCFFASIYFYQAVKSRKSRMSTVNGVKLEVVVQSSDSAANEKDDILELLEHKLKISWNLTKFGLIMTYFYICDRTDFFPRGNKHFHIMHFAVPLLLFLIYGVMVHKKVKRPDILNVEQTTEWKGWMQLIILVYHITGASKKIPIYMQLRDIVAAYFFLSGFGQFFVSWSKEKFGLIRVCEVVFRYNFFVFFLCLVMDLPYQAYYFIPLITFWYFVIYITMAIFPRATKAKAEENSFYYYMMMLKLAALFLIIFLLSYSQTLFYFMFDIPPTNELFRWPGTSLYEWWFRWQLDRYVVPFGMVLSFSLLTAKAKGWLDDSHAGDIFSKKISIIVTLAGLTLHAIHISRAFFCIDKPSCNRLHVYISFIPILSVILFRNALGVLRTKYSVFFAWVGAMSLELFVGQYHVWLAEDTLGILVLVPGYPLINVTVTSFIFVCIALEVRDISGAMTVAMIPRPNKENPGKAEWAMLKRLIVFFLLLGVLYFYKMSRGGFH